MIIDCQKCQRKFNLDERLLKPTGSTLRCSKCGHIFREAPPVGRDSVPIFEYHRRMAKTYSEKLLEYPVPERREHPRIRLSVPASCTSIDADGQPVDFNIGRIVDVSQKGIAIEVFSGNMPEHISVSFIGLSNTEITIKGKVVHSEANAIGKRKIGLELMGTDSEVSEFVIHLVRYSQYFKVQPDHATHDDLRQPTE